MPGAAPLQTTGLLPHEQFLDPLTQFYSDRDLTTGKHKKLLRLDGDKLVCVDRGNWLTRSLTMLFAAITGKRCTYSLPRIINYVWLHSPAEQDELSAGRIKVIRDDLGFRMEKYARHWHVHTRVFEAAVVLVDVMKGNVTSPESLLSVLETLPSFQHEDVRAVCEVFHGVGVDADEERIREAVQRIGKRLGRVEAVLNVLNSDAIKAGLNMGAWIAPGPAKAAQDAINQVVRNLRAIVDVWKSMQDQVNRGFEAAHAAPEEVVPEPEPAAPQQELPPDEGAPQEGPRSALEHIKELVTEVHRGLGAYEVNSNNATQQWWEGCDREKAVGQLRELYELYKSGQPMDGHRARVELVRIFDVLDESAIAADFNPLTQPIRLQSQRQELCCGGGQVYREDMERFGEFLQECYELARSG